ncbi:MAG: OmpA family protein [Pyrinomonadaceae bacterium]
MVKANYEITFDSGSAKIKPSEITRLQEIRSLLIRANDTKVIVEGHTDNVGDAGTNLRLSQERARSVWQWLKDSDPSGININAIVGWTGLKATGLTDRFREIKT